MHLSAILLQTGEIASLYLTISPQLLIKDPIKISKLRQSHSSLSLDICKQVIHNTTVQLLVKIVSNEMHDSSLKIVTPQRHFRGSLLLSCYC